MSLINEALKKAQRQRAAEVAPGQAGIASEPPERVEKRAKAMRAQTVILLAAAAAVLVVFSVVITVYWVNSAPAPLAPKPAVAIKPAPPPAAATVEPKPIVVALPSTAQASNISVPPSAARTEAAETKPPATAVAPSAAAKGPVATPSDTDTPPPIEIPRVSTAPQPDPRVQAFVDSVRVTGIRSSGADSKVIMNDRVYRVNDTVDRELGVKLVKVEPDTLTFADANGLTYAKIF